MHVLDLGCGNGDLTQEIASHVDRVVGVDHDRSSIDHAKTKHIAANLSFIHADAHSYLTTRTGSFDTLVLSHVLEHLDHPKDFLMRFKSFFQWVYIEVPDFDKTYLNHYRKALASPLIHTDDDHVSEFDREELVHILQEAGLTVIDADYRFGVQRVWCSVDPR